MLIILKYTKEPISIIGKGQSEVKGQIEVTGENFK